MHLTVEHFFKGNPLFSMLVPKIGGVPAHPANVQRLLYDEGQLVLVFPEGRKGTEKLYKDRYKLRRFGRGGFVEAAMRAQVPIVPIAVVGAEESMPVFAQLGALQRLTGLLYFPITPTFPHLGLLGFFGYLPAKFKIRFLEPIPTDQWGPEPCHDRGLVQSVADEIRARIQDELYDMLARRTLGVVRMRVLVTGLSSFWGGRLAQALERDPAVEVIIGVSPDDPTFELERTEYVRVGTQHALLRRIVQARRRSTRSSTRGWSSTRPPPARASPTRANVIGTMNILAACCGPDSPVRKFVFKSTAHYYGCEQDDPAFFTERMRRPHPPRTRLERDIVEAETAVSAFADAQPRRHRHHAALRQRPRARAADRRTPRCSRCPWCRPSSASTRATSSSTRTTSSACSSTPCATTCPGVYNAAGDGVLVLSEVASLLGKPLAPVLPPWGTGLAVARAARARRAASRPRCSPSCASAAGWTTASSRPRERRCATPRARPCRRSPSTCGSRRSRATPLRRTATSARSRSSCATARSVRRSNDAPANLQD